MDSSQLEQIGKRLFGDKKWKKPFADAIGIKPETLSRWLNGRQDIGRKSGQIIEKLIIDKQFGIEQLTSEEIYLPTDNSDTLIPIELHQAHAAGKLVFFCGAGVSFKLLGTSGFQGLVDKVLGKLNLSVNDLPNHISNFYKEKKYSELLFLLEQEAEYNNIKQKVIEVLNEAEGTSSQTDYSIHEMLLTLSRQNDRYLLVTTNLDQGFKNARGKNSVEVDIAPKLPPPTVEDWTNPIYLHGMVGKHDLNGRNLILNSADFGRAYLTQGWAKDFLVGLFENGYYVLFIGYSLNDLFVKYLVDAVVATKKTSDKSNKIYITLSRKEISKRGDEDSLKKQGIVPIVYDSKKDHEQLYDALKIWANSHKYGLEGRKALLRKYAKEIRINPDNFEIENYKLVKNKVNFIVWALKSSNMKENIHMAKYINSIDETILPIEWLHVLDEKGVFNNKNESNIFFQNYVESLPSDYEKWIKIILNWIARDVSEPKKSLIVLKWIVKNRGSLLKWMRHSINLQLYELNDEGLLRVWEAVLYYKSNSDEYMYSPCENKSIEILHALKPRLNVCLRDQSYMDLIRLNDEDNNKLSHHFKLTTSLLENNLYNFMKEKKGQTDYYNQFVVDYAWELSDYLAQALFYYQRSYIGSEQDAPTRYIRPAIEDDDQNKFIEYWTVLFDLVRDAWFQLNSKDKKLAKKYESYLQGQKYLGFERLILYIMKHDESYDTQAIVRYLLDDNAKRLYSHELKCERYRLLKHKLHKFTDVQYEALLNAYCDENNIETYYRHINDGKAKAYYAGANLYDLGEIRPLPKKNRSILDSIQADYGFLFENRGWQKEFSGFSSSSHWVGELSDMSKEDFDGKTHEEVFECLYILPNGKDRSVKEERLEKWREYINDQPDRGVNFAGFLLKKDEVYESIFRATLYGLSDSKENNDSIAKSAIEIFIKYRDRITDDGYKAPIIYCFERVSDKISNPSAEFWLLWESLVTASMQKFYSLDDNIVNHSLNSNLGKLIHINFQKLWDFAPQTGQKIPVDFKKRLNFLFNASNENKPYVQASMSYYLYYLYIIDDEWTKETIISGFDYKADDKLSLKMWEVYLYRPIINENLFVELKPSLLFHLKESIIEKCYSKIVEFFTTSSIEYFPKKISTKEIRKKLFEMKPKYLVTVLVQLRRLLESSDNKLSLYEYKISIWFKELWPKRSPLKEDERLVNAITKLITTLPKDCFNYAYKDILDYVSPVIKDSVSIQIIIENIYENGLQSSKDASIAALHLLNLTISKEAQYYLYQEKNLSVFLEDIRAYISTDEEESWYTQLKLIVDRKN